MVLRKIEDYSIVQEVAEHLRAPNISQYNIAFLIR